MAYEMKSVPSSGKGSSISALPAFCQEPAKSKGSLKALPALLFVCRFYQDSIKL